MKTRILIAAGVALAACSSETPVDYSVLLAPAQITITAGRTLHLGAASKGDIAWSVQEPNGGTIAADGTYTAPLTPGTYHVVATSVKDPKKSATAAITVVAAPQMPAISAPTLLTAGKTGAASTPAQDGMTFKWVVFGGTIAGADSGASVSFTSASPGALVLGCTATNAAGDASAEGVAAVSAIAAAATPVISAPAVLTTGRAGVGANVPAQPGITLKWTIGNGAITSGDTAASIVFTAGTPGALALSVVATNAAGDSAPAASASVEIRPTGLEFVAGGLGGAGNLDGVGSAARFDTPMGIAADSAGNAWVADRNNSAIRKVAPDGTVTTVAGAAGQAGYADGVGTNARFNYPSGVALAPSGALWVADQDNNRVRTVAPDGTVSTVSGNGTPVSVDGEGTAASHYNPNAVAVSADGNAVWVFDFYGPLRKLTPNPDGGPTWMVGTPALNTSLNYASGLAVDSAGLVYAAELYNHDIRAVDAGIVYPVSGLLGTPGYANGAGTAARYTYPASIAWDPYTGALYVGDTYNGDLRRVDLDAGQWVSSVAAGVVFDAGITDGTLDVARVNYVAGIAALGDGGLEFTEQYDNIVRRSAGGAITTLAGQASQPGYADGPGAAARFQAPAAVAVGPDNSTYVADADRIRRVSPAGVVSAFAGAGGVAASTPFLDGLAGSATFFQPVALALDRPGRVLYVVDQGNNYPVQPTIRAITYEPDFGAEVVTTVAGNSTRYCDGQDQPNALDTGLCYPQSVAVDSQGRVFFNEQSGTARIVMLERWADGGGFSLTSVAAGQGCGGEVPSGSGFPPNAAQGSFCDVNGMAFDSHDRLFFSDRNHQMIRMLELDAGTWTISDVAGTGSCPSSDGEGLDAGVCNPAGLAFDRNGALWLADQEGDSVRRLTFNAGSQAWKVETLAGQIGRRGFRPGPLPGVLNGPLSVAVTPFGDVVVADPRETSLFLARPPEP